MSDLILYDEAAWLAFYNTLHSSGVLGALLDTGETASAATARKALAAAKVANNRMRLVNKSSTARRAMGAGTSGGKGQAKRRCYWCNKTGHYGRNCPDKKTGVPPSPDSKAGKEKQKKGKKKK